MTELSEKDVRAVARFRFWSKYRWWTVGWLVFLLVVMVVTALFTDSEWLVLVPTTVLFFAGFGWAWRKQSKWEGKLVDKWKSKASLGRIEKVVASRHND